MTDERENRDDSLPAEGAEGIPRKVSTFSWALVKSPVVEALLHRVGVAAPGDRDLLVAAANTRFGKAGGKKHLIELADVLRDVWLPSASAADVKGLALNVRHILTGDDRWADLATKQEALSFVGRQRLNKNLRANLMKGFLAAHKEQRTIVVAPPGRKLPRQGRRVLRGRGAEPRAPWAHQVDARARLDDHFRDGTATPAMIVLPTGSGKTETIIEWLLGRLHADTDVRVLWLVHQQELVDQAIERFMVCAAARETGFERRARAIHGQASELATLADPELDIAAVTIQTLARAFKGADRSKVKRFVSRPTYVVVDEAHHAAAPSYSEVLDALVATGHVSIIGLTATPFPTAVAAHRLLRERFPTTVIDVSPEELIAKGILARPVMHTVPTGLTFHLDSTERGAAERADFSSTTLRRLDVPLRNDAIVKAWEAKPAAWGKSLVFTVDIDHADALTSQLEAAGANVRAIHSKMFDDRKGTLDWFRRATGEAVLVSVGMLNEGVDLPDARTAFLARPTSSRILLRQMIGRVLRGPDSGGEAEAHVVWFQDGWDNFSEVLDPLVVLPTAVRARSATDDAGILPAMQDDEGRVIPADLEAEIAVALAPESLPVVDADSDGRPDEGWVPIDPLLVSSRLVGYYELVDRRLPVFEHQQPGYESLLERALASTMKGMALLSWFDDTHPPYPSQRGLVQLVELTREFGTTPEFVALDGVVGPGIAVDRVLAAGPITDDQRAQIICEVYETTIARAAFPTLERFEEVVEQAIRSRRRGRRYLEEAVGAPDARRPKRPVFDRRLPERWDATLAHARLILPPEIRARLADPPEVDVGWTRRVVTSVWGYWSIRLRGRNAGRQTIRVNRLLRAHPKVVPDAMIEYLLYHELLHHLLPGEGHDAEFLELEARWPDRDDLELRFASFHEQWDTTPKRYEAEASKA